MTPLASDGRIALRRYVPQDVDPLFGGVKDAALYALIPGDL